MRLLCVEHKDIFGGGQVALLNMLAEWQAQHTGVEPLVLCSPHAAIAGHARALEIPCMEIELGAIEKSRGAAWNMAQRTGPTRELLKILRAFRPAAVLANGAYSFLACAFAAKLARVPTVWYEHNTTLPDGRILGQLIREAHEIVVVSKAIQRQFVSAVPQAAAKIHVIYNGVAMQNFRVDADTARAVKQEFGWDETTRVVGTVSRLSPEKNVALFLTAAQSITRAMPDVKFLVAGDGPEREMLQTRFQQGNIVFAGQRADVPRLLQAMDVFVLSSDAEGFPLAIVEAMAAGRAIAATDAGGVREALADGACGRIVSPRDATALADALLELLRDETERRRLGERARDYAARHFTRAQQAQAMQMVLATGWKR